jgi:hypothetical protein
MVGRVSGENCRLRWWATLSVSFIQTAYGEQDMQATVTEIESQAMRLTPEDRALLADHLLASLSPDTSVESAWVEESLNRLAALDSGAVEGIALESALAQARNAIR